MNAVNLAEKFGLIHEHWSPRIAGALNGQHVKLIKLEGTFVWHSHPNEEEMFLVVRGSFALETREGLTTVNEGEFLIVPRGVEHRTVAEREAWVLHFAPEGLVNTGAVREARTVEQPEWI